MNVRFEAEAGSEVAALSESLRAVNKESSKWSEIDRQQLVAAHCDLLDRAAWNATTATRRLNTLSQYIIDDLRNEPTAELRGRRLGGLVTSALGDEPGLVPRVSTIMERIRESDLGRMPHPVSAPAGTSPSSVIPVDAMRDYLRARNDQREVLEIKPIAGGFSKHTIGLQLQNGSAVDDLVIRKVAPGRIADTFSNEYAVLVHVAENGLSVPTPVWFDATGGALGSPFFVTRRAVGRVVGDVSGAEGAVEPVLVRRLAELIAELHRIEVVPTLIPPRPNMVRPEDLLAAIEDRERITVKALSSIPNATGAELYFALFAWLRAKVPSLPGDGVLVHGDIGFHNTLVEGNSIAALLDWELSHLGHAAEDLAYVRPSVEPHMPWADFLSAYVGAGGADVSDDDLRYFSVWQDVWRSTSCLRLMAKFVDGPDTFSDAISGMVHRVRFLDSAVTQAVKGL